MALFDVPGWSIPDDPVAVTPKKRKRTSKHDSDKVQSATVNIEKLMGQLAAPGPTAEKPHRGLNASAKGDQPPSKKNKRAKGSKSQQSPIPTAVLQDGSQGASKKKRKKERSKKGVAVSVLISSTP